MSYTFSFSSRLSEMHTDVFPHINLKPDSEYEVGLVDLHIFNSIYNITSENNVLLIGSDKCTIPPGCYNIDEIEDFIQNFLWDKNLTVPFGLEGNHNTMKCEIYCDLPIDFDIENSIGETLGFGRVKLDAKKTFESHEDIKIVKNTIVRVDCSIASGSFLNGEKVSSIAQFVIDSPPGFRYSFHPNSVIYLPLNCREISSITVKIVDEHGKLIDFNGEPVYLRIHIREITKG